MDVFFNHLRNLEMKSEMIQCKEAKEVKVYHTDILCSLVE